MNIKIFLILLYSYMYINTFAQNVKVRVGVWEFFDIYVIPDSNVFVNKYEVLNGVDDDNNGYIDDINGIGLDENERPLNHSFISDDSTIMFYFHGSAVASTIAKYNSNVEIVGGGFYSYFIRSYFPLMLENLKNRITTDYLADVNLFCDGMEKCVEYFKSQNVRVVNISWYADYDFFVKFFPQIGLDSHLLFYMDDWMLIFHKRLFRIFENYSDIIFVLGAGNDKKDVEKNFVVPACIDLPNVIVVGGLDKKGNMIDFSNYGKNVQTWALAEGKYRVSKTKTIFMEGTSFAAPIIVAWVAKQIENGLTINEIKEKSKGLKVY